jgi:ribosomal protein L33
VRLLSTAQTGFFYTTKRTRLGPRLSAVKYDPKGAPLSLPLLLDELG